MRSDALSAAANRPSNAVDDLRIKTCPLPLLFEQAETGIANTISLLECPILGVILQAHVAFERGKQVAGLQVGATFSIQPAGAGALASALGWMADTLSGNLAVIIAMLAVAGVGVAFLQGRLATRRGARVVVGAFIVFGAPVIAAALAGLAQSDRAVKELPPSLPTASLDPVPAPPVPNPDPYAGASVPQ